MQAKTSKRIVLWMVCALFTIESYAFGHDLQPSVADSIKTVRPIVVAHRGCFEFGPENSRRALDACIRLGVDMVEGDVRATKDGVLVLMHDETLDRTTNFSGPLKEHTYAELQQARLKMGAGGPDSALTDEGIPRFADILRAAIPHVLFLIHVKEMNYESIFATVETLQAQRRVAFLVSARPDEPALRKARFWRHAAFIPSISQCGIADEHIDCYRNLKRSVEAYEAYHPAAYILGNYDVPGGTDVSSIGDVFLKQALTQRGVHLVADSETDVSGDEDRFRHQDPDEIWGALIDLRVSMILTNHAKELIDYLRAKAVR